MDLNTATTAAQAAADFSLYGLFEQASAFVKAVMILLFGMSVVTWGLWIGKSNLFRNLRNKATVFEDAFWSNKNLESLYRHTRPEDADHPMAKLFVIGLREWNNAQEPGAENGSTLQVGVTARVSQLLHATSIRELEKMEQGMPFLATVGSTAPFIGLLGTVWGIMTSFQSIGASKNTSLAVVAPGIAEALLATALGLFAAIPAVIAYNKMSTEVGRYAARLEAFVTEFVTLLERQQQENIVNSKRNSKKRRSTDKEAA